jgi:hypothetical protein
MTLAEAGSGQWAALVCVRVEDSLTASKAA